MVCGATVKPTRWSPIKETFDLFQSTLRNIRDQGVRMVYAAQIQINDGPPPGQEPEPQTEAAPMAMMEIVDEEATPKDIDMDSVDWSRVGRNMPCPCGSGKSSNLATTHFSGRRQTLTFWFDLNSKASGFPLAFLFYICSMPGERMSLQNCFSMTRRKKWFWGVMAVVWAGIIFACSSGVVLWRDFVRFMGGWCPAQTGKPALKRSGKDGGGSRQRGSMSWNLRC
ncbi:MAG: hypothetical protein R2688_09155 [Fimbriimonadaceae bacterium]